jgi:hypothetical protein
MKAGVDVDVEPRGETADRDLAGKGDIATRMNGIVVFKRCHRPARLQRHRREASEQAGKPEAHPAFVGKCAARHGQKPPKEKSQAERYGLRIARFPKAGHDHPQFPACA